MSCLSVSTKTVGDLCLSHLGKIKNFILCGLFAGFNHWFWRLRAAKVSFNSVDQRVSFDTNPTLSHRTETFNLVLLILAHLPCISSCSLTLHNPCCYFSARCVALEVIANGRLPGKCCNQAARVLVAEVVFRSLQTKDTNAASYLLNII